MGVIDNKVFESGGDAAVILPKDIAFALGTSVTVTRNGDIVTIEPVHALAVKKRSLSEMIAALRALGPADEVEPYEPVEFPERPGL